MDYKRKALFHIHSILCCNLYTPRMIHNKIYVYHRILLVSTSIFNESLFKATLAYEASHAPSQMWVIESAVS